MTQDRRSFIKTALSGAAVAAVGSTQVGCSSVTANSNTSQAELKLSFQEGTAPGKSLAEKFDYMEKMGIVGFEPGGRGLADRVPAIQKELQDRKSVV